MGVQPSKTELFLPSDTLRRCDPDRCWCDRPYHRKSRYVYVERGGDGSERYHDPMDMMSSMMMGGMPSMPWKDPSLWTVRDFDRLGEVMGELYNRERGRGMNRSGPYPPWSVPPEQLQPWDDGGGGRRRRSNRPGWTEYNRLEEQFRHMYDEYMRHRNENDSVLYGSDVDRRKDQYRYNMLKTLQEMWPQMGQMMQQQQMYGGGQNHPMMNVPPPPPQMMPPPPQNMYPPGPQMGAPYGMSPGGHYGMMHSGYNPSPMMPGNGMMEPGLGRRKHWGPPTPAFETEHHDLDYGLPRKPHMGRGRWNGGFGPPWNEGTRSSDDPFGPAPIRPIPNKPGGGGGMGGGAMPFDRYPDRYPHTPVPRTPNDIPRVPNPVVTELPRSSPLPTRPQDPLYAPQAPYPSSVFGATAGNDYVSAAMPTDVAGNIRPGILRRPTSNPISGSNFTSQSMPYASGEGYPYASGAMDGMQTGPEISRRPGMPGRNVSFQPEAGLARPRDEEEARGEAEAGAPPSKRDGL